MQNTLYFESEAEKKHTLSACRDYFVGYLTRDPAMAHVTSRIVLAHPNNVGSVLQEYELTWMRNIWLCIRETPVGER